MRTRKWAGLLVSLAVLAAAFTLPAGAAQEPVKFPDVESGHWAESSIDRWSTVKVLQGNPAGNFVPDGEMTRAEFATMLNNLMGYTVKAENVYSDLDDGEWYTDAILKLTAAGVLQGANGQAMPDMPITREMASVMLCRAFHLEPSADAALTFEDSHEVSSWAKGAVSALAERGMIQGVGNNTFAPGWNINRASVAKLVDNMISTYVTEDGASVSENQTGIVVVAANNVTISAELSENLIVAPKAADATVTLTEGAKAEDVVVAAEGATVVVETGAEAGTVTVSAESVELQNSGKVGTVTADAPVTIDNQGSIDTVEANADGVVIDGNAPAAIETAEGVEAPKDSEGNTVEETGKTETNTGSTGGSTGGTVTPSSKYTITVKSATGGTVKASKTSSNTDEDTITLTVTPNPQKGTTMPYILKTLTVKSGDTEVNTTKGDNGTYTFTTGTEKAAYTVTAEFVQPIESAELFIANGEAGLTKMLGYGYFEGDVTAESLENYPYLVLGLKQTDDAKIDEQKTNVKLLANGSSATTNAVGSLANNAATLSVNKFFTCYVNDKPDYDTHTEYDALKLTGSAYTFDLSFEYMGAAYSFTCDYTKPGLPEGTKIYDVNVVNGDGTKTYKAAANDTITLPEPAEVNGKVFSKWDCELAEGNKYTVVAPESGTTITIKAEYVTITKQTVDLRPNEGPATDAEGKPIAGLKKYHEVYTAAGVKYANNGFTVDQKTLLEYIADTTNNQLNVITKPAGANFNALWVGLMFEAPEVKASEGTEGITTVTMTRDNNLGVHFENKTPYSLTNASLNKGVDVIFVKDGEMVEAGTEGAKVALVDYRAFADDEGSLTKINGNVDIPDEYTYTFLWKDKNGVVMAATECTVKRTTTPATYTVTFKDGEKTLGTKKVNWGEKAEAIQDPTKTGFKFKQWVSEKEGSTAFDFANTAITKDTEVFATWTAVYKVTFKDGDKTIGTPVEVEENGTVGDKMPANPTKDGYEFVQWVTKDGDTETKFEGTTQITADTTVYATWKKLSTVSAVAGGMPEDVYNSFSADLFGGDNEFPALANVNVTITVEGDTLVAARKDAVPYVTNFTAFNQANEAEQAGYYILVTFHVDGPAAEGVTVADDTVVVTLSEDKTYTYAQMKGRGDWDGDVAVLFHISDSTKTGAVEFCTVDLDGNGTEYKAVTYKLDYSGLTFGETTGDTVVDLAPAETTPEKPETPVQP